MAEQTGGEGRGENPDGNRLHDFKIPASDVHEHDDDDFNSMTLTGQGPIFPVGKIYAQSSFDDVLESLDSGRDANRLDYFSVSPLDVRYDSVSHGSASYGGGGGNRNQPNNFSATSFDVHGVPSRRGIASDNGVYRRVLPVHGSVNNRGGGNRNQPNDVSASVGVTSFNVHGDPNTGGISRDNGVSVNNTGGGSGNNGSTGDGEVAVKRSDAERSIVVEEGQAMGRVVRLLRWLKELVELFGF